MVAVAGEVVNVMNNAPGPVDGDVDEVSDDQVDPDARWKMNTMNGQESHCLNLVADD